MLDIIGKKYIFFLISLLVIIPGLISLGLWGLNLSQDFTGGSLIEHSDKRQSESSSNNQISSH